MMIAVESFLIHDVGDPRTAPGALLYGLAVFFVAALAARIFRSAALRLLDRDTHGMLDRTVALFLIQLAQIGVYLVALIFYAHLIPALRSIGTALLAGVSIASIVVGLAAQSTLSNLVSGVALLLYRPFRVGDRLQMNAPTGLETGEVESITLGYTILKTPDRRRIIVPNNAMINQVTIRLAS